MSNYDFIVVGAGSAGGVLLNRLSENPAVQVLALEAGGGEPPPTIDVAPLWFTLFGSSIDWGYQSVPQPGLDGRQTYEPRGKYPGGSSNLYIMMHIRGDRADFDNWAYNGAHGWGYEDLLPYFAAAENQEDDTNPTAGHAGPLPLMNASKHDPNPTSQAFVDACVELGYPLHADLNGPDLYGTGWHHINVVDGQRYSVRRGYIEPAQKRANLTLATNAHVTRLLFDGTRCTGVEYVQDGQTHTAQARHEVIVSGGAIESPHLLLLSGVGPAAQLKEFAIPVVADLPGVGENFHNHVLTGVVAECAQPVPVGKQNNSEVALFCKSEPGVIGPDLQFSFVHVPFDIIIGQTHPNAVSILPGVVRPLSRGWIRLASSNPLDKPLVNPNYLSVPADAERLAQGVQIARDIFATRAFAPWFKEELLPGPDYQGLDGLRRFVRQRADSFHHQAGSCKMGLDDRAVVDPQLRVYGVQGLRVCDASVMPQLPSANCHAAIVAIAERLAARLMNEYGLHTAAPTKHRPQPAPPPQN